MVAAVAERHRREAIQALDQQPGADQQDEGDGDLRHHQAGAQALPLPALAGLRAAVAQRRHERRLAGHRRPGAEHEPGRHRHRQREEQHAAIDGDLLRRGVKRPTNWTRRPSVP